MFNERRKQPHLPSAKYMVWCVKGLAVLVLVFIILINMIGK